MALVLPSQDFAMASAVVGSQQQVPSTLFRPEDVHILLVDDENVSRMVVGNLLRKCNYKVTVAESGQQALELLREAVPGTYQLILTDVMMPEVDGLEVLRYVRANEVLKEVPVVMMSANEQTATVFQCIQGGAEEYLVKPVTKKEVQNIWKHVWKRQSGSVAQAQQQQQQQQQVRRSSSSESELDAAGPGPSSQSLQHQLRQQLQQHLQHTQQQLRQQHPQLQLMPLTQHQQDELVAQLASHSFPPGPSSSALQPAPASTGSQAQAQQQHPLQAAALPSAARRQLQHQQPAASTAAQSQPAAPSAAAAAGRGAQLLAARNRATKVLLSKWLLRPNRAFDHRESTWLFCELLLQLEQLVQQQGHAAALPRICPSNLLLHSSGQMTFVQQRCQRQQQQQQQAQQQPGEHLYLSPEEVSGQACTAASSIYSLGVLLFELFHPLAEVQRLQVLQQLVRDRIMPPAFLKQLPTEAALCMALLHPDPAARPSLQELVQHEKLGACCEALRCRRRAQRQEPSTASAAGLAATAAGSVVEQSVLVDFLQVLQSRKQREAAQMQGGLAALDADIGHVSTQLLSVQQGLVLPQQQQQQQQAATRSSDAHVVAAAATSGSTSTAGGPPTKRQRTEGSPAPPPAAAAVPAAPAPPPRTAPAPSALIAARWDHAKKLFPHLEAVFLKRKQQYASAAAAAASASASGAEASGAAPGTDARFLQQLQQQGGGQAGALPPHLAAFAHDLSSFCKYQRLSARATMRCGDMLNTSSMVCSIALDRDDEFFATAGVSKRMRIYEYRSVSEDSLGTSYPVLDISSRSRLSSVCWSSYVKGHMLSADYEGVVTLWDVHAGQEVMQFEEHAKRVWSVDFSRADPTRLVSGSDDGCVKLWSVNSEASTATIETKVNVCCVQFSPTNSNLVAFGSANYRVYMYDLRNTSLPLAAISGHSKAVSYVRFLGGDQLVSASTDSTLRLWDVSAAAREQPGSAPQQADVVFRGHQNEKNFVGLAVLPGGYIACGSENNSVYCYYQAMPVPLASHSFSSGDGMHVDMADVGNQFVSSVCWSARHNTLLAANSTGAIKVLALE